MDYVTNVGFEYNVDDIDLRSDGISFARDGFVSGLTVVFVVEVCDMMVMMFGFLYDGK